MHTVKTRLPADKMLDPVIRYASPRTLALQRFYSQNASPELLRSHMLRDEMVTLGRFVRIGAGMLIYPRECPPPEEEEEVAMYRSTIWE